MSSSYLWVKALHIIFVASWFAGLFYLPASSSTWPWWTPTARPSAIGCC